ncbi:uncharacterized protein LOC113207230 [Frankliniella occidentalis]|uniref:Uncharacterized protein LOC113207230 n=1 Tax=Frankliniella occidentalis TaxID=133901 RepID=A0A6J1SE73_FRAOC|nr:uncharacterized protein LOC113207230 [Frankliniella occidentalis]
MDIFGLFEAVLSLRPNGPEYLFWKKFFGMVNENWLRSFEERTRGGSFYIYWDFIEEVDSTLPMGQQYQQALGVVSEKTQNTLSSNNCGVLLDTAMQVLNTRKREHSRFPEDPNNSKWVIHEKIIEIWSALVNQLQEKASGRG